jgi:hypothetical protein
MSRPLFSRRNRDKLGPRAGSDAELYRKISWLCCATDTDRKEDDASNNSSMCGNVFMEPLPSNDSRGYTYRHTKLVEEFMKYAVEMGSGEVIYITNL